MRLKSQFKDIAETNKIKQLDNGTSVNIALRVRKMRLIVKTI